MILSPQLFWKQPVFMVEQSGERLGSGEAATGDRIGLRLDRIERKRPWYDPKRHSFGELGLEVKWAYIHPRRNSLRAMKHRQEVWLRDRCFKIMLLFNMNSVSAQRENGQRDGQEHGFVP